MKMHATKLVKAHELNPVPYNPNKMSPAKYEALKESIRTDGFIEPIVVQKDGMNIIGGHHRLKAIKEIAVEDGTAVPDVPCIILDVDDVKAKKLNLKLNNLKGEADARLLGEVLVDLFPKDVRVEHMDVEIANLGMTMDEAAKLMNLVDPSPLPTSEISTFGKSVTLSLEFSSTSLRDKVKKALQDRAKLQKKKSGNVVAELLTLPSKGTGAKVMAKKSKKNGKAREARA